MARRPCMSSPCMTYVRFMCLARQGREHHLKISKQIHKATETARRRFPQKSSRFFQKSFNPLAQHLPPPTQNVHTEQKTRLISYWTELKSRLYSELVLFGAF
jgi:hypothetical protein